MTADALAGKALFESAAVGCATCHTGTQKTDSASRLLHDVGTITAASGKRNGQTLTGFDTPTLNGIWETAPYLHDGSAATLLDVITTRNASNRHGNTSQLSSTQKNQLVAYLQQLDVDTTAPTGPLQAENAALAGGVIIETTNTGFNGSAYVNFSTSGGSLTFNNVSGNGGGTKAIRIRFALGAAAARTGVLVVNGASTPITFQPTGAWTTWQTLTVNVTLTNSSTNTIALQSNGADLANIDELTVP